MGYTGRLPARQRMASGGATLTIALAVGAGLLSAFDLVVVKQASHAISAIALPAPKPPEPVSIPDKQPHEQPAGAASAANLRARAAPVLAIKPPLPLPDPPPIAAAPKPGAGSDTSAGAAPVAGPGAGAGGQGDGIGAGGAGKGTGGATKAVWRSGAIRDRDYPREASRAQTGGEVEVRFTIEANGRVTGCRVTRSSGDASLDATTCRLIEARFRFRPATNAAGEPIASTYGWRQSWWLERRR
ncbi:MAG TPA: energy transducer TonB [Sphingopyxis sp.]|nr:energy transducer TonB [Sphingopyxis sp.]HMP44443.1 energy transducer TonB [Sphingopyxis sp.]HMQ17801.1 energy transducer TonB [Sphingopyxis sp.]